MFARDKGVTLAHLGGFVPEFGDGITLVHLGRIPLLLLVNSESGGFRDRYHRLRIQQHRGIHVALIVIHVGREIKTASNVKTLSFVKTSEF